MTEAEKNIFEWTVEELRMAKEQLRWRDATKKYQKKAYMLSQGQRASFMNHILVELFGMLL